MKSMKFAPSNVKLGCPCEKLDLNIDDIADNFNFEFVENKQEYKIKTLNDKELHRKKYSGTSHITSLF